MRNDITIGVTGASGSCYAERLINVLVARGRRVHLIMTPTARRVIAHELGETTSGISLAALARMPAGEQDGVRVVAHDDMFDLIASGSSAPRRMAIVPCSMGTLARVASGLSTNLLDRAADVILKESRRLVISPRECPLSLIHLRHMTTLAEAGARVVPPIPGFYNHPRSIDDLINFTVGRILDQLDEPDAIVAPWTGTPLPANS